MTVDASLIGRTGARTRVVIERCATANFVRAIKDDNAAYVDVAAAADAGCEGLPVPLTYLFCAAHWGAFEEIQPEDRGADPFLEVVRGFRDQGGLQLHGEQEFEYRRPLRVGDVLDLESEIVDVYDKGRMTFAIVETRCRDSDTGDLVAVSRANYLNRR